MFCGHRKRFRSGYSRQYVQVEISRGAGLHGVGHPEVGGSQGVDLRFSNNLSGKVGICMKDWEIGGDNWGTVVPEQDDFGPKMRLPSAVSC
jgi:hypothetical protein